MLGRARGQGELSTTEGGSAHPDDTCRECFNRGLRSLGCWTALMKIQEGRDGLHQLLPLLISNDISSAVHGYNMLMFHTIFTFTLTMTEVFSQNFGKVFQA